MNTLFSYLYRDACNYKEYEEVVVEGVFTFDDIRSYLHEDTFFIPSEVGLADLQGEPLGIDDHIWHEIDSIKPTNKPACSELDTSLLIKRFKQAKSQNWNEYEVFRKKGIV